MNLVTTSDSQASVCLLEYLGWNQGCTTAGESPELNLSL